MSLPQEETIFPIKQKQTSLTLFDWPIITPPKVGIIITHYNYSYFIEGAITSILNQTYNNFECVIVDDNSNANHKKKLENIISRLSGKIEIIWHSENQGQTSAFYTGFKSINADFYCLLDPDDKYFPTFIEEMVGVHLNPYIYVPMVCCNQVFTVEGRQVTGTRLPVTDPTATNLIGLL